MKADERSFTSSLSKLQLIEIDSCTRCGECLKHCPVQDVTGNPAISPPEKIRMFREFIKATDGLKARFFGPKDIDKKLLEDFTKAVYECTTCGACGENCTVGIYSQRLWPMLRNEMVARGLGPFGGQVNLPKVIAEKGNPYNKPAEERYSPWFPEGVKVSEKADVAYYAGCTGAYDAQPMVIGDVRVFGAIKEPFTMLPPEEEVCCGFPLFVTGQFDMLEDLVKRLVAGYKARGVKVLVSSCPCCVNIMARDWPSLYGKDLPFKIRHMTQYVVDSLNSGRLKVKRELKERLIYHDPCYLSRGVGVMEEPREVLKSIPGVELLEFDNNRLNSKCCGAGGAARKVFLDNAYGMARMTIDEAVEKKADKLILSCPACHNTVNASKEGHDKQIPVVDIMEVFADVVE